MRPQRKTWLKLGAPASQQQQKERPKKQSRLRAFTRQPKQPRRRKKLPHSSRPCAWVFVHVTCVCTYLHSMHFLSLCLFRTTGRSSMLQRAACLQTPPQTASAAASRSQLPHPTRTLKFLWRAPRLQTQLLCRLLFLVFLPFAAGKSLLGPLLGPFTTLLRSCRLHGLPLLPPGCRQPQL